MSGMDDSMGQLVGRRIRKILVAEGDEALTFVTDAGNLSYVTEADCCSETWFADIMNVEAILGEYVASTDVLELPQDQDERGRQESDEFYGVRIGTRKGAAQIIYRNSSNGYYGGNIVFSVEPITAQMTEITKDWQAGANKE